MKQQTIPEETVTRIRQHLATLKLTAMRKALDVELAKAAGKPSTPTELLERMLGIETAAAPQTHAVLVVEYEGPAGAPSPAGVPTPAGARPARRIGVRVDGYGLEIDAYVRPLKPPLSRLWGVSGITIMGDGRPVFVIDLQQVISKALNLAGTDAKPGYI